MHDEPTEIEAVLWTLEPHFSSGVRAVFRLVFDTGVSLRNARERVGLSANELREGLQRACVAAGVPRMTPAGLRTRLVGGLRSRHKAERLKRAQEVFGADSERGS